MTDDDETEKYTIYFLKVDEMSTTQDGVQVAATMKSLAMDLHQIVRGNREATTDQIRYSFMRHVSDLFQFARVAATITKLEKILETLQQIETTLNQEEDAEPLLRNAWQLMRKVLSQEEIEKISATQIELQRSGMDPIMISVPEVWEQANRTLQEWSTPENEDQRVEYIASYSDGSQDGRWLNLPLFYKMESGDRFQIEPTLDLGKRMWRLSKKALIFIVAIKSPLTRCVNQY